MKAVLKNNQRLKKNYIYKTKQYVKPAAAYSIGFIWFFFFFGSLHVSSTAYNRDAFLTSWWNVYIKRVSDTPSSTSADVGHLKKRPRSDVSPASWPLAPTLKYVPCLPCRLFGRTAFFRTRPVVNLNVYRDVTEKNKRSDGGKDRRPQRPPGVLCRRNLKRELVRSGRYRMRIKTTDFTAISALFHLRATS